MTAFRMQFLSPLSLAIVLCFGTSLFFAPTMADQSETRDYLRYLALGDSYTIGEGVAEKKRWPVQLANRLAAGGIRVQAPEIIAKSGWTTDELLAAIEDQDPKSDHDLVTLLIGVNNQYRGRSAEDYRPEFEKLLKLAIELARGDPQRVIVVSIPDYGITPFIAEKPERDPKEIATQLDAFNLIAQKLTRDHGANWVDVTFVSREHGGKTSMLAEDNLHPSGRMYQLWTDEILPVARSIFVE